MSCSPGEAGLKRLARSVDAAVAAVGRLLIEHIQPGLEAAAFRLSEACGLARCSAWLAPLALQVRGRCCIAGLVQPPYPQHWTWALPQPLVKVGCGGAALAETQLARKPAWLGSSIWGCVSAAQEEAVAEAQAQAHGLLLAGEQARLQLVAAGVDYRTLFAWLLTTIRQLNEVTDWLLPVHHLKPCRRVPPAGQAVGPCSGMS